MTTSPPAPLALPVDVRDHRVPHPDGTLFARTWTPSLPDAAAPVLLFHDSLGCVELWRDFPERLCRATGRPVIAWDRLGFARSDPRAGPLSLDFVRDESLRFLPALRAHLGVGRFVALGHSVGGGMALNAAADWPDDVEAVVTIAAQAFVEERTRAGIRDARDQFQDPVQVERLARYHGDRTPWVLQAWIGTWLGDGFSSWSLQDVLPRVRCPVLVLHGEDDEYGSTEHPRRIAAGVAGPVRCVVMPGTRHVPHRERPDEVLAVLRDVIGPPAPGCPSTRP